jgi:hypothetical protein
MAEDNTVSNGEKHDASMRASQPSDTSAKGFFRSGWATAMGAAVTAAAGIAGAWTSVQKSFWATARQDAVHTSLAEQRDLQRTQVINESKGSINAAPAENLTNRLNAIEKDYEHAKKLLLTELKLDSPLRKVEYLRRHQRWEAMATGLASAAVALGVVTTLIGFQRTSDKQDDLERELQQRSGPSR